MNKILIIVLFSLFFLNHSKTCAQWGGMPPENYMLMQSLNSYMYYLTKDPVPFSDPRSLIDVNRRTAIYDNYHESREQEIINNRLLYQQRLNAAQMKYNQQYRYRRPRITIQY